MASAENLRKDAEELSRLSSLTESQNIKRILNTESAKLFQLAELAEKQSPAGSQNVSRPTTRSAYTTSKLTNYGWDQSDKFLKIYVTFVGVQNYPSTSINATFTEKSFELQILDEGKKINHELTIKNLLHPIIISESYSKVKTDMVVLFLKKASSQHWAYVTEAEKKAKDAKAPKFDKEEDPSASLMSLMKQMYDDGDDEMKRTIAKAWTEARDKKTPEDVM